MKKLFLITISSIIFLLISTNCFASDTYLRNTSDSIISPVALGILNSASSPVITTAYSILPFGTTTNITKLLVSCPIGTAYIGDSSVTGASGLALAATQNTLIIDTNSLVGWYWTGPAGQKVNFVVIK